MSSEAAAVSDDGTILVRCKSTEAQCTFSRVADGRVVAKAPPPQSAGAMPILETPGVKKMLRELGFSDRKRPWPLADAFVDWSLAPKGSAITYYLRDRETPATLPIGRFVGRDEYLFPIEPSWSANGLALVLTVWERPVTQGIELRDAVVDLPAAAALLYLRARDIRPDAATTARAEAACNSLDPEHAAV